MKICLTSIVKNEAKIIGRCLDSCKSIIDYVCITDTGSTDDTIKIISEWGKKNNIPVRIFTDPWKDFSYNRNLSLEHSSNSFPDSDYLLLIDADMVLVDNGLEKESMKADGYMIKQLTSMMEYSNIRLVSTKLKWLYQGVTHEFIHTEDNSGSNFERMDKIYIKDMGDGGSKENKYNRDKRLLVEALEDPNLSSILRDRYWFYLGQTYFETKNYREAIEFYTLRTEKGNKDSVGEYWYAKYQLGICYSLLNDFDNGSKKLLEAYNYNPKRYEPLVSLCDNLLKEPRPLFFVIDIYLQKIQELRERKIDDIFVNYSFMDEYYIDYMGMRTYYYVGRKEEGRKACERLINNQNAPEPIRNAAIKNIGYYLDNDS